MKTQLGSDGLVRKVVLKYKLPNEKTFRLVDRPIHGIAVVVPVEEQPTAAAEDTEEPSTDDVVDVAEQSKKGLNPMADPFSPCSPEC